MLENSVSAIIPMYNVEAYAAECIESVIKQTHKNLEIILVNDGSTDSTPEICRSYAEKDSKITVIDKENGGPTSCRLLGKNSAKGEYIYFADADDVLYPEIVESLLEACVKHNAEIAACGYEKCGGEDKKFPVKFKSEVIEKADFEKEIILPSVSPAPDDTTFVHDLYWNHIYKSECLSDDCFISDRICAREDAYTNLSVLKNVNRIAVVDRILYRYRRNPNSITVAYRENKYEKDLYFVNFVKGYLEDNGISCEDRLSRLVYAVAYGNIDNFCKKGSYDFFKAGLKKMYAEPTIESAIKKSLGENISKAQKIAGELYLKKAVLALYNFRNQNLGDMALTYAHEKFLRDNFPDYEVIMVAGYKTYPWMKELQRILTKDDIITILGGGNMDDLYVSLENARRFVIRQFPNNPVVSFPQTMGFTDTAYGRMRKKKTIRTYNKNKNLKIFTREPKSLAMMKESFNSEIGFVPDMVLYLNKTEPKQERDGVLCVLRSDLEMHLSDEESENIKTLLRERYGNVEFTDTVNVTQEECKPENLSDTLERFWAMLRTKKVVVTDRLHCMIFCAITKTPCVVFDNSNNKTSGVFESWLKDYGYIRMCGSFDCDKMLKNVDELLTLNLDECHDHDLSREFAPLIDHISSKVK